MFRAGNAYLKALLRNIPFCSLEEVGAGLSNPVPRFRQRNGNGKNTTRPLTVWIVGTDVEREMFFVIGYGIIFFSINQQIGICR